MCRASISVESSDYFTGPDNYSCSGIQGLGGGDPLGWIHLLTYTVYLMKIPSSGSSFWDMCVLVLHVSGVDIKQKVWWFDLVF